jgi:heptosyltransferase I
MPRLLIVKTSSLGDVIHALPALTDLKSTMPDVRVDWVVEKGFAAVVRMHPGVDRVHESQIRQWRKTPFAPQVRMAFSAFKSGLQEMPYDNIVDLQGLVKSALLSRLARGLRQGYAWGSAREPLASILYQKRHTVSPALHAVARNRMLLAAAIGYAIPAAQNYGLPIANRHERRIVCCHATSKDDKLWPEAHWRALIAHAGDRGYSIDLPWGNPQEQARSKRLAQGFSHATVAETRLSLTELAPILGEAAGVVGVDTGFLHLAAALGVPTLGIYVATAPGLSGAWAGAAPAHNVGGKNQCPSVADVLAIIDAWMPAQ